MSEKDINDIISIICPNDEDFEKTCISPAYLKKELEVLALEQEPILDKIRAEIMSLTNGDTPERIWNVDVLEIIDKYKAESEET